MRIQKTVNEKILSDVMLNPRGGGGGGILRYISDGDVRSPFLGLKFAI